MSLKFTPELDLRELESETQFDPSFTRFDKLLATFLPNLKCEVLEV